MSSPNAKAFHGQPGLRVAAVVAGTLVPLLALMAIVRPEMMNMATLHRLMYAAGL